MKKRIIVLLSSMLVTVLLCSCGSQPATETITSEKTQTLVGSYSIFRTIDAQEYLNFLEKFDETKYEIIDISTSLNGPIDGGSDEFYIVTYKTIAE